jgi:predicted RNase H-like HicB family nuclease
MRYPIAIEPQTDENAYGVVVPDLPGCFSAGDTLEEAIAGAEACVDRDRARRRRSDPTALVT